MGNKLHYVVPVIAALIAGSGVCAAHSGTLEDIKASGKVRIGIPNINPYGYIDGDGHVTGQAPELTRAFFADMGVKEVDPVVTEWGALIGGLMAGRFDIIATGMLIQPERCRQISFGNPEYKIVSAFAVRKGNPLALTSYQTVAKHDAAKIGMLTGAGDIRYAELAGVPAARRILFPDFTAVLAGLQAGRVDAVVASTVTIRNALTRLADPELEYAELTEQPLGENGKPVVSYGGMGFRKEDAALREAWNSWLTAQLQSGKATQIMAPFGFGPETQPSADITADQICSETK